jgi:hypothetical protein
MLVRALSVHIAHETAGAARIRHSLRPLTTEGEEFQHNPGASRRGIAKSCFPSLRAKRLVRRSLDEGGSNPSCRTKKRMDCFVARAPRNDGSGSLKIESNNKHDCRPGLGRDDTLDDVTTPSQTFRTPRHNPDASATAPGGFRRCRRRPTACAARRVAAARHCPDRGCRNRRRRCGQS